ncbi:MAG: Uncharacterized protein G01um101418_909 [Parcubacteria group bacterium Gr01-1014_18]|nr:MAG: Uncharacterized protein Greene041636_888 [Parcubacteria group bacterium Greene0416_36]TSC79745.1 MAG: Uncharacterized protein G01um101418_909 [Parcubacteria group bacterium Gr01-1014_18]TSC97919.1 MAG: Uncharacterized protein Greene101420_954 [Parcubacteria group bacterium Greene1014_20]TSD06577.1 MAG: Uncharacterized protein Greene07142_786 [Parcubacteria group bacterium Greene0714_2]
MKRARSRLIPKAPLATSHSGLTLVEVLLSSATFMIVIGVFMSALITSRESLFYSGAQLRALYLAEEGLEATRNIGEENFGNLTAGTRGLVQSGGQWGFLGTQDIKDIFTRSIVIADVDADTKQITSNITWQQNPQRQGNVSLVTELIYWRQPSAWQANSLNINTADITLSGDNKEIRSLHLQNTGTTPITIDKMTVSWTGNDSSLIERIRIGVDTVWSLTGPGTPTGSQPRGTELNIVDYSINGTTTVDIDNMKFSLPMENTNMSITFTMGDSSQKTVNFAVGGG